VGRIDNQIKIRGQRLELAEVETVLCTGLDGADESAVIATEDNKIIAYVKKKDMVNTEKLDPADSVYGAFQYDWRNFAATFFAAQWNLLKMFFHGAKISMAEIVLIDGSTRIPISSACFQPLLWQGAQLQHQP
jgi:hypothetical protein